MTTWLQHVKKVHASGSTSFKESLKRASVSWKKLKGKGSAKPAPAKKGKKKRGRAAAEEKSSTEPVEAPKKKGGRKKRIMPKIPVDTYKSVDSRNL